MTMKYRKFDEDFKAGAVRLVLETRKAIAQVARELGVNEGTLGNWCAKARAARDGGDTVLSEDERAELNRLRKETAELWMRPCCAQALGGPLGGRGDRPVAVATFIAAQRPTTRSRTRPRAERWECPSRGSTSGATVTPRPSTPAASSSRSRSPGSSPSTGAPTAHRGSPLTCARKAGWSARTRSRS